MQNVLSFYRWHSTWTINQWLPFCIKAESHCHLLHWINQTILIIDLKFLFTPCFWHHCAICIYTCKNIKADVKAFHKPPPDLLLQRAFTLHKEIIPGHHCITLSWSHCMLLLLMQKPSLPCLTCDRWFAHAIHHWRLQQLLTSTIIRSEGLLAPFNSQDPQLLHTFWITALVCRDASVG